MHSLIGGAGVELLVLLIEAYSHMLVYWSVEGSITTVSTTKISNGKDVGDGDKE